MDIYTLVSTMKYKFINRLTLCLRGALEQYVELI